MRVLFIHRSVGQQLVDSGDVRGTLRDVSFFDLNANYDRLTDDAGRTVTSSSLHVPDGDTEPGGLANFFSSVKNAADAKAELGSFDVVAFKSCYSANNFGSDEDLERAKQHYLGPIASFINEARSQRFLIVSPPPRRPPLLTTPAKSRRAKDFAGFLEKFATARPNCAFFDLFGELADDGGCLRRAYRRNAPWDQHPNVRGAARAGRAFAEAIRLTIGS